MSANGAERGGARTRDEAARGARAPNLALRRAREGRCWSQEDVAGRLGTTPFTVCRWERSVTSPGPHFRQKLCALFERGPEELGLVRPPARREAREMAPLARSRFGVPAPAPAGGLVGRARILADLRGRILARGRVAVQGLPGAGKTALAAALADDEAIGRAFPDGVFWVGLGPEPDAPTLLAGLAAALGVSTEGLGRRVDPRVAVERIRAAVAGRAILFVLDDVWRLDDALAFGVGGPRCAHLITTRLPLIASYFDGDEFARLGELGDDNALDLLARFAPGVVADEPEAARDLVRVVGGLPLALTLAGRYLRARASNGQPRRTREALRRLRDAGERLRLVDAGPLLDRPPSPAAGPFISLASIIALSERRLSAEERRVLRVLALFPAKPNAFPEAAALAVGDAPAETLDALCDAGLVEGAGPGRYALHQTIADYARAAADAAGEAGDEQARERMVAFWLAHVERHATGHAADHAALDRELLNIGAALDLAHAGGMAACLARLAAALAPFLLARGMYALAEAHLARARAAVVAGEGGDRAALVWLCLGRLAELRGRLADADGLYEEGLRAARGSGDRRLVGALLAHRGEAAINRGEYVRAGPYLEEGLRLARELDDRPAQADLLRLLGEARDCAGRFDEGDALYLEGLRLAREADAREAICALLQNLGEKATKRGRDEAAGAYLREGLGVARGLRHAQRTSALLAALGTLARRLGDYERAQAHCREAVALAREIAHPVRLINALRALGAVALLRGDGDAAEGALGESLALARAIGHPFLIAECLCGLGELRLGRGERDAADAAFREADEVAAGVGAHEMRAAALHGLARAAAGRGDLAAARAYGDQSLAYYAAEGHERAAGLARWLAALPAAPE